MSKAARDTCHRCFSSNSLLTTAASGTTVRKHTFHGMHTQPRP